MPGNEVEGQFDLTRAAYGSGGQVSLGKVPLKSKRMGFFEALNKFLDPPFLVGTNIAGRD